MASGGENESTVEFPPFPKKFEELEADPVPFKIKSSKELWKQSLILRNTSKYAVLYKVKCSSNERIKIKDCVDILQPNREIEVEIEKKIPATATDQLLLVYVLVGRQWSATVDANAFKCWERVKSMNVPVKSMVIDIKQ